MIQIEFLSLVNIHWLHHSLWLLRPHSRLETRLYHHFNTHLNFHRSFRRKHTHAVWRLWRKTSSTIQTSNSSISIGTTLISFWTEKIPIWSENGLFRWDYPIASNFSFEAQSRPLSRPLGSLSQLGHVVNKLTCFRNYFSFPWRFSNFLLWQTLMHGVISQSFFRRRLRFYSTLWVVSLFGRLLIASHRHVVFTYRIQSHFSSLKRF